MKGRYSFVLLSIVLTLAVSSVRTHAAEWQSGTTDMIPMQTAEDTLVFTPVPSSEASCTPKEAFAAYKAYLQSYSMNMGGQYTINNYSVNLGANLAFWDVTGDNIPEIVAACQNRQYNKKDQITLYMISCQNGSARELVQASGNNAVEIFWDQTYPHQTYDSVCFSAGKTLYVLTLLRENEGGYFAEIEWIYKVSYDAETNRIVTDEVLQQKNINGEITWLIEGSSATQAAYTAARKGIVEKADQGILTLNKGPMGSSARAYQQLSLSPDSYLGMTYEDAQNLLTEQCSLSGWQKIDGKWYFFNDDGTVAAGWKKISGSWYHFTPDGVMQKEWQKIGGKWYYLGTNGAMVTGWKQIGNQWYYFESGGTMAVGWQKINSKWYYFASSGAMQTGWLQLNGKYYHLTSDGAMQTGWQKIKDVWYFFKPSGVMAAKEWYNGYYLNANGSWTYQYKASWKQDSKGWWFGDESGWYAKSCTITINDKQYTFDAKGYMVK